MTRRPTASELRWPFGPEDADAAAGWAASVTVQVLDWTWRAFDSLGENLLRRVDFSQPLEQVERDLASQHFCEIQELFRRETEGFSSIIPVHEWPEMESRSSASAKPPAYDLAFISNVQRRWAWPIEAKVVKSAGALAEYLGDVNDKFVTGVAAPLVGEGAMIGYLLVDAAETAFENLADRLGQPMTKFPEFFERPHRTTFHRRPSAPDLRLHHLMMTCVG